MARTGKLKIAELAMSGAGVAGGIVVGRALTSRVPQLAGSPLLSGAAQLLIGGVVYNMGKGTKGGLTRNIGVGMAANAAVDLFKGIAGEGMAAELGLSGLGAYRLQMAPGSTAIPGVAGAMGQRRGLVPNNMTIQY